MQFIEVHSGLYMTFCVTDEKKLLLLHLGASPLAEEPRERILSDPYLSEYLPIEIKVLGLNSPSERHASQVVRGSYGILLQYVSHEITETAAGKDLTFLLRDPEGRGEVKLHYDLFEKAMSLQSYAEITNLWDEPLGLEDITSFALNGLETDRLTPYRDQLRVTILHNGWQKELCVKSSSLEELGLPMTQLDRRLNSSKVVGCTNTGNFSTKEFIPCVYVEKLLENETLAFQIEHNGSWHWQIGEHEQHLYLRALGPSESRSAWFKDLKKGETFRTVPVGVTSVRGTMYDAARALTLYRRAIRRPNGDNEKLYVIFNDYMNCLFGEPTTEKELPMIDAAAEAGCEIYCIDCGWYSDGFWWDNVGEWLPAEGRFPGGFRKVLDAIRAKGMIPGLWLELEVVGINSPLVNKVPKEWFFRRHGRTVQERSRYQLDFRNPEVRAHATEVIRRLVEDYGAGYIKMDYNIDLGTGTDYLADSPGDGLLEHNRAYLAWLKDVFRRYPDLIIENCSSGGMRMDYAQLSTYSVQSTSDLEEYRPYATISVNAPLALTPEQAAVWSYPLPEADEEETVYNMANTLLLRIHQSGHLQNLSPARFALVKEGISFYKSIRDYRKDALPFWPLGFSSYDSPWLALGLQGPEKSLLSVWRRDSDGDTIELRLPDFIGKTVRPAYPLSDLPGLKEADFGWNPELGTLIVHMSEKFMARVFVIE